MSSSKRENRPSPSASAAQQPLGKIMKGNDGTMYEVVADKNGKHRWTKVTRSTAKRSPKGSPKRSKSPRRKSKSPRRKSKSPRRKSKSPRRKSKSPRRKSKSPKRTRSPRRKAKSPHFNNTDEEEELVYSKLVKKLASKMEKWWFKLSNGKVLVVYKDGKTKFADGDVYEKMENDSEVKAFIWSSRSYDNLTFFVYYILKKFPASEVKKLMKGSSANTFKFALENFRKLFKKFRFKTNKDYYMKSGGYRINAKYFIKI